ncbi:hypothetical protein M3I54_09165 [Paraburkholderia sp. CNPSo 3274]|uniref:hypothetical protein n=1 Tax=Paraburkholderia sp. CNPSo 3274 TaxID=2940932 RepID=UPI0020B7CA26|nr:hypothetical protein [Paraburkholderia sp. CNPSo 3274]MCP3707153.1 hypothetical protein [Paraburkholderia sp. CNPSo 3274]
MCALKAVAASVEREGNGLRDGRATRSLQCRDAWHRSTRKTATMLEAHLNIRLLNRPTRSLSLTEIGKDYLEGCREIIDKLDEWNRT